VNGGDAEIGFSYAHTAANGFNGKGKFDKSQENVRHFATLYGSMFQMAVRADSDIQTITGCTRMIGGFETLKRGIIQCNPRIVF